MRGLLAEKSPAFLLEQLGIEEPHEIWLEAIAQACQATIVYEPLEGCEGRLIGYQDKAIITVNRTSSQARQRFSAAHELGHWMWDRGRMAFQCAEKQFSGEGASESASDHVERRANRFAAELLLPTPMFRKACLGKPIHFSTVQELAHNFRTSLTATAIRLVELCSAPAVLVCSDISKRRWASRSEAVSPYLLLRDCPAEATSTQTLLLGGTAVSGAHSVISTDWFGEESVTSWVQEDAIRIGNGLVLTLLSWDANRSFQ